MERFEFTAVRQNGEKFSGTREAESKHALVEALRTEGSTALSVDLARRSGAAPRGWKLSSLSIPFFSDVPNAEKILFARNLSSMITGGLSIFRALTVLLKQTKNAAMHSTLEAVSDDIRQGHTLSEALSRHPKVFSPIFIAMSRSGEESGTLAQSLTIVAAQMEHSFSLAKKVKGAMIYPAIILTVMIGIGVLMLIYVVPTLSSTFASLNTDLPLPTRIIIGLSDLIIANAAVTTVAVVIVVSAFIAFIRTRVGGELMDRAVLAVPVVGGIVQKVNAARTARTLSSLLAAGVSALNALAITSDVVQNTRFRPIILEARELVEKGKPLSDAFVRAEHIFPVMFSEMMAVGEETGDVPGMLAHVADMYEEEVEQQTKDLSTIIEPVLMVVIGAAVGFFAIAMIMPIYSLSSSI